ncbi:MAG: acyl-CoA desaturase [Kofleriaceae bacterium]|nr:MAG: acyl-CoA desaturase [Kofleriaceae bacterium]MBZ0234364.1 acyl-CoA desaturase [Kofleriaceae bacterium]
MSMNPEELEAFGAEIQAVGDRVTRDLGERDARYIHELVAAQRRAEVAGRALLFAGAFPPAWISGVALLTLSKVLENMEIGHNVLHGQYDWMNDPELDSTSYEWDWLCLSEHWRHGHNYLHHTFTNIVGVDRDLGYGLLRMAEEQPWRPVHLPQPLYALAQALTFEWAVAVHDLELDRVLRGEKKLRQVVRQARPLVRKAARQVLKDYVLFPVLAGPSAPFVLTGNLSANLCRNVWAFLVIFCGHFPDGVQMYLPRDVEGETRAGRFLRQIRASANVVGPRWFHILSGNLSHQIEHHLFPDLPACRYPDIAVEIQAICRAYGVPYNTARFSRQVATAMRRVLRLSLPGPNRART